MSPSSLVNSLDDSEEDSELRDLVTNLLRESGTLGKMKARLRSEVYTKLDDGNDLKKSAPSSPLSSFLGSSDGRLLIHLVSELLDFFQLKFTLSVFGPEALEATKMVPKSRAQLIEALGLSETMSHAASSKEEVPILAEILRLSKVSVLKSETPTPTNMTEDESSMPSSMESTHKSSSGRFGGGNLGSVPPESFSQSNASTPLSSFGAALGGGGGGGGGGGASLAVTKAAAPNVASVAPMPSGNASSNEGLDGTFTVSKDSTLNASKDKTDSPLSKSPFQSSSSTGTKAKEDSLFSKPKEDSLFGSPKPAGSKHFGDLPKLGSPGSGGGGALGNLPPLGGIGGGPKKTLAPLKKSTSKDKEDSPKKASSLEPVSNPPPPSSSLSSAISNLTLSTSKTAAKTLFGGKEKTAAKEDEVEEEISEEVSEDIDFLSSSGRSASEEATKDETVSEIASLRADYVEKV